MLRQRPSAVFLILPAYSLIAAPAKSGSNPQKSRDLIIDGHKRPITSVCKKMLLRREHDSSACDI
jgi:hypothetical protein